MNREKILEFQNKLITEMAASVWANTKAEENIAVLAYINGVHEFANMLLDEIAREPDLKESKYSITSATNSVDEMAAPQDKAIHEVHEEKEIVKESTGGGTEVTGNVAEIRQGDIAEAISTFRSDYNLTMKDASVILGIHPSEISKFEKT